MLIIDLVINIDSTLDQLIKNSEIFQQADIKKLSQIELEDFQNTQASLLNRFLFMNKFLAAIRKHKKKKTRSQEEPHKKFLKFKKMRNEINLTIKQARHNPFHRASLHRNSLKARKYSHLNCD